MPLTCSGGAVFTVKGEDSFWQRASVAEGGPHFDDTSLFESPTFAKSLPQVIVCDPAVPETVVNQTTSRQLIFFIAIPGGSNQNWRHLMTTRAVTKDKAPLGNRFTRRLTRH